MCLRLSNIAVVFLPMPFRVQPGQMRFQRQRDVPIHLDSVVHNSTIHLSITVTFHTLSCCLPSHTLPLVLIISMSSILLFSLCSISPGRSLAPTVGTSCVLPTKGSFGGTLGFNSGNSTLRMYPLPLGPKLPGITLVSPVLPKPDIFRARRSGRNVTTEAAVIPRPVSMTVQIRASVDE